MSARIPILAMMVVIAGTTAASADAVVAARTIPARSIITAADLSLTEAKFPGSLSDPSAAVGLEAQVTLYQGRPVAPGDVGPPTLVDRNDIVALVYSSSGLRIVTEGRVLDRAAQGDRVRVMNLASRITVTGTVVGPGEISVP